MQLEVFIGRKRELSKIDTLVKSDNVRRILIIDGPGGVGKTRLLQEVDNHYRGFSNSLMVTGIFDFDETSLRIPGNLTREIALQIGRSSFERYFSELDDLTRMETSGVSPEKLETQVRDVNEAFIECYKRFTKRTRIIMLFDTLEIIRNTETWFYLENLLLAFDNTLVILAGRKTKYEFDYLIANKRSKFNKTIVRYQPLTMFNSKEVEDYFVSEKLPINNDLLKKLLIFTHGHPILLALANEWLRRQISLPELVSMRYDDMEKLDSSKLAELQEKFKKELVSSVMSLPNPLGQVILLMAYVDRYFDIDILSKISGLSHDESIRVNRKLKDFGFIKKRPRGIALHDELKFLVRSYLWSRIDPTETERRELCGKVTIHYDELIKDLETSIIKQRSDIYGNQDPKDQMGARSTLQMNRNELQVLHIDRLHYAWQSSPEDGLARFRDSFDIKRRRFLKNYYRTLLEETRDYENYIKGKAFYDFQIDKTRFLRWDNKSDEAFTILREIEQKILGDPVEQANFYSAMAGYFIDEGNLSEALSYAERSLNICQRQFPSGLPILENLVGMIYRRMGLWEKAEAYYERVIEHIDPRDTKGMLDLATALNNLSFLNGLRGDWSSGLFTCQRSLQIREKYGSELDIAYSLYTLGSVYWAKEDFTKAFECYDSAYSKLHWPDHSEMIARVHFGRGIAYWFAENYEAARTSFEKCIVINKNFDQISDLPLATHNLGHIYWELGDLARTEELFKEGYDLSIKYHDYLARVDSLAGFAELYYKQGRLNEIKPYVEQLKQLEGKGFRFPLFSGRVERILGDIEFDSENYETAFNFYSDGLVEIAHHGGYGKYSLHQELLRLAKRIDILPPEKIIAWCENLSKRWIEEGLATQRPEMMKFCLIWRSTSHKDFV